MTNATPSRVTDREREWIASLLVLAVALTHRAWLLWSSQATIAALWEANPDVYQPHNAPIELLRDHLGLALLYLQQTPPMSNLILGLMVKLLPWPYATTLGLIAMQGVITALTAVLLQRLLFALFPGRIVFATLVALAFVFDTDVIVIEYNTFGQLFYENLGMLLVLSVAISLLTTWRVGRPRDALVTGVLTALLAMTRATWTVFLVPGALLVALLVPRRRLAATLAFVLPIALVQGGWVVKNGLFHGRWVTTTWAGFSPLHGLGQLGEGKLFTAFIVERGDPPWFSEIHRGERTDVPAELTVRDAELAAQYGIENWDNNSARKAEIFAAVERNFYAWALQNPDRVLRNTLRSYAFFWRPIANFGHIFVAPYCTAAKTPSAFDVPGLVRVALAGELPEPMLRVEGFLRRRVFHPVMVGALTWLDPLKLLATALGVHLLAPIAGIAALVDWRRGRLGRDSGVAALRAIALLVCGAMYLYVAGLSSVVDYGENMRFRLGVEPLIWVLTILGAVSCLHLWRDRRRV